MGDLPIPGFLDMRKNVKIIVCAIAVLLCACTSAPPSLIVFATESGATQYFFPMMEWKGDKKDIGAVCDITYRYEPGSNAVCNFSFTYTAKNAAEAPPLPSALSFTGDGVKYSLSGIDALFSDPAKKQIRVTSLLEGDNLPVILRSQSIELNVVFDGTEYRYYPSKRFLAYRGEFLLAIRGGV
ncbi:MAG: hypothetical protein LBL28_02280 [Treponema sp.]|jgi:hypothetical protein|nr:hypothetical protein [Treponema sp.]